MNYINDSTVFCNEIKRKVENDYQEFSRYQTEMIETLCMFHDLCEENKITYYLSAGSLLGAVRNGCQLPWDYDIDIFIPIEQAYQVVEILKSKLSPNYHFQTRYSDKKYRTYAIKLCPKKYDPEILHVDIFWLVGANVFNKKRIVEWYNLVMNYKYISPIYLQSNSRIVNSIHSLRRFFAKFVPGLFLDILWKVMSQNKVRDSDIIVDVDGLRYKKEWYFQRELIELKDGNKFYIAKNYEEILNTAYTDYKAVPPIDVRIAEMYHSLNKIRNLGLIKD